VHPGGHRRGPRALASRPDAPSIVVVEHPLLVETGGHARVDTVVVVEAPVELRIARLVRDRGMTEAAAREPHRRSG
jgi:dephospho-CoA kinase